MLGWVNILFVFFLTSVCYPERVGICAFGGSRRVVEEGLCLAFFLTLQPLPRRRRPIFDGGLRVHAQDDRWSDNAHLLLLYIYL